jgi:hypothetical protein
MSAETGCGRKGGYDVRESEAETIKIVKDEGCKDTSGGIELAEFCCGTNCKLS